MENNQIDIYKIGELEDNIPLIKKVKPIKEVKIDNLYNLLNKMTPKQSIFIAFNIDNPTSKNVNNLSAYINSRCKKLKKISLNNNIEIEFTKLLKRDDEGKALGYRVWRTL